MTGIALTFDDGPDAVWTSRLLDLLRDLGARATFFPIATRAKAHPGLIRRMRDEGHTVGLHCDEHVRHTDRDGAWVAGDTASALARLRALGVKPALWRTPWGVLGPESQAVADRHGLRIVGWSVDSHDWRGDPAAEMFEATRGGLTDGAVVLAHDGLGPGARREDSAETLNYVTLVAGHCRIAGLPLRALT